MSTKIKRATIAAVVVGALGISIFTAFGTSKKNPTVYPSLPLANTIQHSKQMDDTTLYYFTGSAFASYSLSTHKSTGLSSFYALPTDIITVVWSKSGALFGATGYRPGDQLYAILQQKNLSTTGTYWWAVDFTTKNISLLGDVSSGADVRTASWQQDGSMRYFEKDKSSNRLNLIQRDRNGATSKLVDISDEETPLCATSKMAVYVRRVSEKSSSLYTVDTTAQGKPKEVAKNVLATLDCNEDGSVLFIAGKTNEDGEQTGELKLYNQRNNKTKQIISKFSGEARWRYNSEQWVASGNNGNGTLVLAGEGGKYAQYGMPENTAPYNPIGMIGTYKSPKFIATDSSLKLYTISSEKDNTKVQFPNYDNLISQGVRQTDFTLMYVASLNAYSAYILTKPYDAQMTKVISYLQSKGYDPYQMKLLWFDGTISDRSSYNTDQLQSPSLTPDEEAGD